MRVFLDDVPPLVKSISVDTMGAVKITYFDGLEMNTGFHWQGSWREADAFANAPELEGYAIRMWPYLKRCQNAGIYRIDLPPEKITVTL